MQKKYNITIKKFFGHLHTINKHRWIVFKLSIRAGIPLRGLLHDLSKYHPIEFIEGVKYYTNGEISPAVECIKVEGYSKASLHHKNRNKHPYEYWLDESLKQQPEIPYKYVAEMICDMLAASITYQKEKWTKDYQLSYWLKKRERITINSKIDLMLTKVFEEVSRKGINDVITGKNLKSLYKRYVNKNI